MEIKISGEAEKLVQAALASGKYASVDEFIEAMSQGVQKAKSESINGAAAAEESHDAWQARLKAFVARQKPTGHAVDDSRESIYPDRS